MAQTYRYDEIKAGAVILGSLLLLAAVILLIGRGGFETTPKRYRIEFSGVAGLEEGGQVRLGGVRVGRVIRIAAPGKDSPRAQVLVGLRKDVVLRAGTEAVISTLGLVGEHFIDLSNPKPGPEAIPEGAVILGKDQASMGELMQVAREAGESAKTLLTRVRDVVDGPLNDLLQRTGQMMNAGDRVLKALDQTLSAENRESLRTALGNANAILAENRDSVRTALANANAILAENREPLRASVADLEVVIKKLDGVTAEGGALIRRLDATVADGGTLIRKLDEAVDEKGGDLKGTLKVMKLDLERAKEVLDNLDRAVTSFDRAVTGNLETIEETLTNLRRATQNAKELTQTLKDRPWQIIFPESMKDRDVAR